MPIARWLCHRQGHQKTLHKTFSLLPFQLLPYHRHGLNVIFDTLSFHQQHGTSFERTKRFISDAGVNDDLSLENNHIHDFMNIFSQALLKLSSVAELKQQISPTSDGDRRDPVNTMLQFITNYESRFLATQQLHASNAEKLAVDFFYHFQTGDYFQRHFLFGTPSHKLAA